MKNKVVSIYITSICTLFSLISATLLFFCKPFLARELLLNLSYGIFGGSFLSLIISSFGYSFDKKEAINAFYEEYFMFLKEMHDIYFFNITNKDFVVAKYNFVKLLIENDIYEEQSFTKTSIEELKKDGVNIDEKSLKIFLELEFDPLKKLAEKAMESYVRLSHFCTNSIWRAGRDIYYFLSRNRKMHREQMELCRQADDLIRLLGVKAIHFNGYLKENIGNLHQMLSYIDELNHKFYTIKKDGDCTYAWETVFEDLLDRLNTFLSFATKTEYDKREKTPFYFSSKNVDNTH